MPSDFTIGEKLKVTLFGQSHGPAVGCVIEGFPAGRSIPREKIEAFMARRAPRQNAWSTARKEKDQFEILSGLNAQGLTCGAPVAVLIPNADTRSRDYDDLSFLPRPGHADFTASLLYGDSWDHRGGGQFSARLTAPLCFAGALCMDLLEEKDVRIAAHIARVGSILDAEPDFVHPALPLYAPGAFPAIDPEKGAAMQAEIEKNRQAGDSVDGAVRCIAAGFPAGFGGPYFGGLEGIWAKALFGIPAVKGISFGDTKAHGSENNDPFRLDDSLPSSVGTVTNHCGGILGGISNGMPLCCTVSLKPTPSIALPQQTVNVRDMKEASLTVQGRHDPCVVPRAVPVVEAVTALVLADLLLQSSP